MNLGDVKVRVKRTFGDESAIQVTDEDIKRWVNDGQREVVMINTGLLEQIATADLTKGQQEYAKPTDLFILHGLTFKNVNGLAYYHGAGRSLQELHQIIDGWDGTLYGQSNPVFYTEFAELIRVFPIPANDVTDGIKVWYSRYPRDVTIDADEVDLPISYHSSIVSYCLKQAYELDEDWVSANNKIQEFTANVNEQRNREKLVNQEYYPRITVLPEDLHEYYS